MFSFFREPKLPRPQDTLPGRPTPMPVAARHVVLDAPLDGPFEGMSRLIVGMGCFWGAERLFWRLPGVVSTAVGYAGGATPNPTYRETCSGQTGHTEVVRVIYDPARISAETLMKVFWEGHDPTSGMRQGNDVGTQYRSALYWTDEAQRQAAERTRALYQAQLKAAGHGEITTELRAAPTFYFAEDYHQQYLAKNPGGYCGLGGTGVSCPIGLGG